MPTTHKAQRQLLQEAQAQKPLTGCALGSFSFLSLCSLVPSLSDLSGSSVTPDLRFGLELAWQGCACCVCPRGGAALASQVGGKPFTPRTSAARSLEGSRSAALDTPCSCRLRLGGRRTQLSPHAQWWNCASFRDCSWPSHLLQAGGLGFLSATAAAPSAGAEPPLILSLPSPLAPAMKLESPFLFQGSVQHGDQNNCVLGALFLGFVRGNKEPLETGLSCVQECPGWGPATPPAVLGGLSCPHISSLGDISDPGRHP